MPSSSHKRKRTNKSSLLSIPTADRSTTDLPDSILCEILLDLRSIISADRISELPDPILCHILSFLPTKQAATTSVLSKRWKPVWLSVFALDFDDESFKDFDSLRKFVYSTMFSLRDKNTSIHSFTFKCGKLSRFTQKQYDRILKMVMQVENLNFDMSNKSRVTKLPPRIFSFKTLQVLKLTNIQAGDFDQVDFPHLKTLHLNSVWFISHEYIVKFLLGCPILENLQSWLYFNDHNRDNILKNLSILPNLVKVMIFGVNTPMALVCKAKILHVERVSWMKSTELPMFHNLIHLELSFDCTSFYRECSSLLGILPHFPKLQHFNIQDYEGALSKHFKYWKDPSIVSECLSSKLKTCCIRGYRGTEYEFGLAKYIMQHSKVLETMTIKSTCLSKAQKYAKLSSCTMASTTCKLLFY